MVFDENEMKSVKFRKKIWLIWGKVSLIRKFDVDDSLYKVRKLKLRYLDEEQGKAPCTATLIY